MQNYPACKELKCHLLLSKSTWLKVKLIWTIFLSSFCETTNIYSLATTCCRKGIWTKAKLNISSYFRIIFHSSIKKYCLTEALPMSAYNIFFGGEIRKICMVMNIVSFFSKHLTFTTWSGQIQQITNWWFFLSFPRKQDWHFIQIVSSGDNLHDMSNPVFWEKLETICMKCHSCFLGKLRKIVQCVICWKFYPEC